MLSRRWIIFLTASMLYFVGYFHRVSITVIVEDLMKEFSASATSLGIFSSFYFYPYALMQIPAGLLIDKFGSRKTLTIFCFVASIGTLIFSLSPSLSYATFSRLIIGFGVSVAFLGTAKLIASWFNARSFASLIGILVAMGNVGALLASAPLALMVIGLGWRLSFFSIAFATFALTGLIWLIVKDTPMAKENNSNELNSNSSYEDRKDRNMFSGVLQSIKTKDFWLVAFPPLFFFGSFISLQGLWGVQFVMQIFALSKVEASIIVMMMSIGFSIGALFWGIVSDRLPVSRKNIYLFGLILYVSAWLCLTLFRYVPISSWLHALFFFLGFFFGVIPISVAMVKSLFPLKIMGTATGAANALPFVGGALYPLLFGYVLDVFGLERIEEGVRVYSSASYELGFMVCLFSLIFATGMIFFIKNKKNSIQ
ncbi:MAG: MFS transporter [Candidatus Bathyarchaeota archaeon]|nr:MFS transporter [Candidatus Bathyarchaeota archaeon]